MLDFTELPTGGTEFELLIRELLFNIGHKPYWSGVGPDGGRDILCIESINSELLNRTSTWLVQCKHNAHSGASVGIGDLDSIVDSCTHHNATGYILACSTKPSSAVINRLESITKNDQNHIIATCWDSVQIERLLSTPSNYRIAQTFFPNSSTPWKIFATDWPNRWVVAHRGYYFHLSNRIGSNHSLHLSSIDNRINDIESIDLPKGHALRPRAVYYDDKNGHYTWYIDYMYPHKQEPKISRFELLRKLGNDYALEDGQMYNFDIAFNYYLPSSDHFDIDHYDYYTPYAGTFSLGVARGIDRHSHIASYEEYKKQIQRDQVEIHGAYLDLCNTLEMLPSCKLIRSTNAQYEFLEAFHKRLDWSHLLNENEIDPNHFFSAWFIFNVEDEESFLKTLLSIPQSVEKHIRVSRHYDIYPGTDDSNLSTSLFEVSISIHPLSIRNKYNARKLINEYFQEIIAVLGRHINQI